MNSFHLSTFRRAVVWLVTVAMLLPVLAGCVVQAPPVVRLDGIVVDGQRLAQANEIGLVRVTHEGVVSEARAGMELHPGDRIETGPRAEAVIRYPSGSELMMRPGSSGRIGSFTDAVGEFFTKVKGVFSIDTTFVKAGARGTAYLVRSTPGGSTTVVVFDGTVLVESTTGAWAPVALGGGSMGIAYPRAPQPTAASAEELHRTRDWVERLEKLVPPKTGVSGVGVAGGVAIAALIAAILAGRGKSTTEKLQNENRVK